MRNISKLSVIGSFCLIFLFSACKNEQEKKYEQVLTIEKSLSSERNAANDSIALVFIRIADEYVKSYKSDPRSSEILFKTGQVLNGLGNYPVSIRKFQEVFLLFPNSAKASESMFICGFINENNLHNYKEAEYYYRKFIKQYPQHPLAKDAKFALTNLGKTPEEMVREFEQKNYVVN